MMLFELEASVLSQIRTKNVKNIEAAKLIFINLQTVNASLTHTVKCTNIGVTRNSGLIKKMLE